MAFSLFSLYFGSVSSHLLYYLSPAIITKLYGKDQFRENLRLLVTTSPLELEGLEQLSELSSILFLCFRKSSS